MKKIATIMGLFGLIFVQAQVGINQDAPQATLDIKSEGNSNATKALKITNTANTEIVTVTDDGKVGIGTDKPKHWLTVTSTNIALNGPFLGLFSNPNVGSLILRAPTSDVVEINVRPSAGKSGFISFTEDAVADRWVIKSLSGKSDLRFATGSPLANYDKVTFLKNGNVGIGTIAPTEKLEVSGGNIMIKAGTNTADFFPAIIFNRDVQAGKNPGAGKITTGHSPQNSYSGSLIFQPRYYDSTNGYIYKTIMTVDASGVVDVNGDIKVQGTGATITDNSPCTKPGTISYGADNNFYGCAGASGASFWKKLHN